MLRQLLPFHIERECVAIEIQKEWLEEVTGGTGKEFQFTCPYCNIPVPMSLEEERVTCFQCKRIVLDLTRIHSKKKTSE